MSPPATSATRSHTRHDGDVLLHAICDALLGAAGLGDIGMHFPDSDPRWRGADSRAFVRHVRLLLQDRGYRVVNVDATVIAEAPRLGRHREAMRANIGSDLALDAGAGQHQGDDDAKVWASSVAAKGWRARRSS